MICCSRKKGFHLLLKLWHTHMFQPDWLILRILHQSSEIERPKGHWSEILVHLHMHEYILQVNLIVSEGQKPLSLTSTSSVTPVIGPSGSTAPNIIEISSTSASHGISTLQVPNVSSIIRGQPVTVHHSTPGFSHLPRG